MHTTTTSTTTTTTSITAIAVGAALLVAACGSDAEPLTKSEFVAQANTICQQTNDQLEPIFETVWSGVGDADLDDPDSELLIFARWDAAMDEVVPIVDEQLKDIRALAPPTEDEELIDTLLADQEAAIAEFARLMEAAAGGDQSAMADLDADDPFVDIDRRAREYGLTVCGEAG